MEKIERCYSAKSSLLEDSDKEIRSKIDFGQDGFGQLRLRAQIYQGLCRTSPAPARSDDERA